MKVNTDLDGVAAEIARFHEPLPDKPEESAEAVARALWSAAAGHPVSAVRAMDTPLADLDAEAERRLRDLIERKRSGVPLAYLTERQTFMGLDLLAGPGALIPRRETELLGAAALGKLRALADDRGTVVALDICTGSGNLAIAYAALEPRAVVHGADLSAEAIDLARRNQAFAGVSADRLDFAVGDLFAPFDTADFAGRCDLVSCNPPYISAARLPGMHPEISSFEPSMAFDGGTYGVAILRRLIREAPRFLKPESWLCFEVGAGQGSLMARQLGALREYATVETIQDAAGEPRALLARSAPR